MPIPLEPKREQPGTYFAQNRANQEELRRLQLLDYATSASMGGVLPEQPDPTIFPHVLDVGCGTGGWLIELARTTPTCTLLVGVDKNPTFIEYARAQADVAQVSDRVEFRVGDALGMLEFPVGLFDLVNHRFAVSWLRTWDWPKLLQEYRRVARPGGVIRITEGDIWATNGQAHARVFDVFLQAMYRSGHYFLPGESGATGELAHLLSRHGFQQVQTRDYTLEYHSGTPEGPPFFENIQISYQTVMPFLRKWARVPENYEEIYQEAICEMQRPDFVATWHLLTAWGRELA
ncbi:MAG TPA: class I SAM-dependent methyltransferase [Ktedonobacteraceae bacterium]|nr:class I SAM-dependent methyltransferase [Ktedonobacteraceae bacterium]